jgi:cytochrome P450
VETETTNCPYARYRKMREKEAATQVRPGVYAVTRYEDCKAILADWKTYSAVLGDLSPFATFGPSPVQDQIDEIMHEYREKPVLMRTDPPLHTRVRNLVNRTLMPAEVEKIAPQIQATVNELAAPWIGTGKVEFMAAFAALLPNAVTTGFLGAPPPMRAKLKFWAQETMSRFDGPQSPERQLEVARNIAQMARYFLEQIADRRKRPTGDLVSLLAHAEIDGDRLEDTAIINVISTFLIGGHETTTYLLGNSLWRLARDADLAGTLRADPAKIPSFIEEMLRTEAPAQTIMRSPTRPVEIGGVKVPAGAVLLVTVASANRDEAAFDAPDDVRLERRRSAPSRQHLAFGYGIHSCIGLNLARSEVRIALETLLPRMQAISPASDDPIEIVENFMLRGPVRLDLRFTPSATAQCSQ